MKVALVLIFAAVLFALLGLLAALSIVLFVDERQKTSSMVIASFVLLPLGGALVGTAIARFGIGLARLHPEPSGFTKEL